MNNTSKDNTINCVPLVHPFTKFKSIYNHSLACLQGLTIAFTSVANPSWIYTFHHGSTSLRCLLFRSLLTNSGFLPALTELEYLMAWVFILCPFLVFITLWCLRGFLLFKKRRRKLLVDPFRTTTIFKNYPSTSSTKNNKMTRNG